MDKTIKFTLLVLGIALFVYGISLIPLNASLNIFSLKIEDQNLTNSYLVMGLGILVTSVSFIKIIDIKS